VTKKLRFLALGDSYTCGEGLASGAGWPNRLAGLLRAEGVPLGDPEIVARTGWTTDELQQGIAEAAPSGSYDLVSLLVGVNDQYRGRDAAEYELQFRELLAFAVARAGGDPRHVLVLSIPDWGVTPFAEGRDRLRIAREIDAFNRVNLAAAEEAGAHYVDVTPISRREPELLVGDQLHPSAEMYEAWARLALPAARRALLASPPGSPPPSEPSA
jgi:lysophospholipase L1-like esterase